MIISALHKFIFVAIPKTGTHSVRQALREHMGRRMEQLGVRAARFDPTLPAPHGHLSLQQVRPLAAGGMDLLQVCVVRNPLTGSSLLRLITRAEGPFDKIPRGDAPFHRQPRRGSSPVPAQIASDWHAASAGRSCRRWRDSGLLDISRADRYSDRRRSGSQLQPPRLSRFIISTDRGVAALTLATRIMRL